MDHTLRFLEIRDSRTDYPSDPGMNLKFCSTDDDLDFDDILASASQRHKDGGRRSEGRDEGALGGPEPGNHLTVHHGWNWHLGVRHGVSE
jgi:hypothetical protein